MPILLPTIQVEHVLHSANRDCYRAYVLAMDSAERAETPAISAIHRRARSCRRDGEAELRISP